MTDPHTDDPWRLLVDALPDGAVLTDAASPQSAVLYANRAFERLTGYAAAELVGRPLPVFNSTEGGPASAPQGRGGAQAGAAMHAMVRGVHRDGSPLLLEVRTAPVRDAGGHVTHWASVYRRPETRMAAEPGDAGPGVARQPVGRDGLTGLLSRAGLEARLREPVAASSVRSGPLMAVFFMDVDDLAGYNDTFGRAAGDAMLKRVAAALGAAFRRSSDVLARWDGGTFAAASYGMEPARAQQHADSLRTRVRDLCIHHPRSKFGKFVSVTVAVATAPVGDADALAQSLDSALASLGQAKVGQPVLAAPRCTLP